jgi:transcriptional regulator with XRE-family HTH domain
MWCRDAENSIKVEAGTTVAASTLLRTARSRAGITQRELARRTGVSQGTIARIELGDAVPRLGTLEQLLAECGVSLVLRDREAFDASRADLSQLPLTDRARAWLPVMVDRIVRRFHPDQVILFGSQVRGHARSDSDVDLLVVLPRATSKREARIAIRRELADVPIAKDILVTTPDELARRGHVRGAVLGTALAEGVSLYVAT